MLYQPPVGGAANDPYVTGVPGVTPGSIPPGAAIEDPQREIINVIVAKGLTPNAADRTQLYQAIQMMIVDASADYIVRYTTTGNIALSGLGTQAGGDWSAALDPGDPILVSNQTAGGDNGWFIAAAGAWTRTTFADVSTEIKSSALTRVRDGTTLADTIWMLTTDGTITLGTTALTFIQQSTRAPIHVSASMMLTVAYWGRVVIVDAAATIGLPLLSGCPDGVEIIIGHGAADGTSVNVPCSGTNKIRIGGGEIAALPLARLGDLVHLVADKSAGRWVVVSDRIMGPSFEATTSVVQTVPVNTTAKLQYNVEIADPYGCYDAATYRFTPSIPGFYHVSAQAYGAANVSNRFNIVIYKTGAIYISGTRYPGSISGTFDLVSTVDAPVYLAVGDYVEIYGVAVDTNIDFQGQPTSKFTAMRIHS